jgi:hypothetical protein
MVLPRPTRRDRLRGRRLRTRTDQSRNDAAVTRRWKVVKRYDRWRVLDNGAWHETHDTLAQAHTAATQLAVMDACFQPGGLTALKYLRQGVMLADWELELLYSYYETKEQL